MKGSLSMRVIAVMLAVAASVVVAVYFYCPCSRLPGGYLLGDEVVEPVSDWSFANAVPLCQIEVRARLPHSVNLNCMANDGRLYLSCANCADKRWSRTAQSHPDARLRLGDSIYRVRLSRVEDPAELDVAWRARADKVGMPVDTSRADGWWSFRVNAR